MGEKSWGNAQKIWSGEKAGAMPQKCKMAEKLGQCPRNRKTAVIGSESASRLFYWKLIDYLAIMVLFAICGHYAALLLKRNNVVKG